MARFARNGNGRTLVTQQSVNAAVKSVCDIMRRSNCAGAMQYVPELTWILFLRILDETEEQAANEAAAVQEEFTPSLVAPFRWRDWAAPDGAKREELRNGALGSLFGFVHGELLPYLKGLREPPGATPRQKVIAEVMSGVERVRIDTEKNFLDVLDKVHEISAQAIDKTHVFPLSQVYEGLLLRMGEKGNDGGQFFTPREVIRAMVRAVEPQVGETVYDPACGTGGFLAQSYEQMQAQPGLTSDEVGQLKHNTFFGKEKENLVFPIALANLVLHGIDQPNLWHGNTLTGAATYDGLFQGAPALFDVVLTNPPFGGKEGKEAQTKFAFKTGATQVLFLQHIIGSLKEGGRCGIVIDEGVLFRTNERAFVDSKRKLLDECDLWCIVSLPAGVFLQAGGGVKTNLLFFTKGGPTEKIWYYDLSDVKVTKKTPLMLDKFDGFFAALPERETGERSWTVDIAARRDAAAKEAAPLRSRATECEGQARAEREQVKDLKSAPLVNGDEVSKLESEASALEAQARELKAKAQGVEDAAFDLKAVNPNARSDEDTRTPEELLDLIEAKGREVAEALAELRRLI
ncbi:MAG: N-6 DNA methylase [Chloroflexi bacterium]|nr:N-6 DNA methylase [Chloroflexota bacterium]